MSAATANSDAYLDQLIAEDEARLLSHNRYRELSAEARRQLLYQPSVSHSPVSHEVVANPKRTDVLHLSKYEVDGFANAQEVEDQLMREYQRVKETEKLRRTAAESGFRGHSTVGHTSMASVSLEWHKHMEAENYHRDLYKSTLVHPPRPNGTHRAPTRGDASGASSCAVDRMQTLSNSRVVGPYLTLHSAGRFTRYEALQQRYPIHHTATSPKSVHHPMS